MCPQFNSARGHQQNFPHSHPSPSLPCRIISSHPRDAINPCVCHSFEATIFRDRKLMTDLRPISSEGMDKLKQELDWLYREERPRLLIEIAAAAAQGDRSENAEYIYGKKRLREIDKRMRQLDDKINHSQV